MLVPGRASVLLSFILFPFPIVLEYKPGILLQYLVCTLRPETAGPFLFILTRTRAT